VTAAPTLPAPHATFLRGALERIAADPRLLGVAAGGSYVTGTIDEHSDLDLVVVVEPSAHAEVMAGREAIAAGLGSLLVAFTGEHVAEPRLLICLYGPPLLHVDLKFVRPDELAVRVEEPVVLWERDRRVSAALAGGTAVFPTPRPQWIEDRFWVWVHYVATKLGRGELFEAVDALGFIRGLALGPMILAHRGARPTGVRKIESAVPEIVGPLAATIAAYDVRACRDALAAAVALYRSLRAERADPTLVVRADAESAAVAFLDAIDARRSGS
jgi:predicted nucleotidyltransferase